MFLSLLKSTQVGRYAVCGGIVFALSEYMVDYKFSTVFFLGDVVFGGFWVGGCETSSAASVGKFHRVGLGGRLVMITMS